MVDSERVIELLLVLLGVGVLGAISLAASLLPPEALLQAGGVLTAVGLVTGVPTGFWYHVALYRALRRQGPLPERWWLHPVPLHAHLDEDALRGVLPWFLAGGLGFVIVVLGCAVVVLGLAIGWLGIRG